METVKENPLGVQPVGSLLRSFAVPGVIAMLVSAIYSIVDQIFIGHTLGPIGNAAVNVAFPFSISTTALGALSGIGGAANFNLASGRKEYEKAPFFIGNALTMLSISGILLTVLTEIFLSLILKKMGTPEEAMSLARTYLGVTAIGFTFQILTFGGGHLIRADRNPSLVMKMNLAGTAVNIVLDAVFILVLKMGILGAALATVTGQIITGTTVLCYIPRFKTVPLKKIHFIPQAETAAKIASIGVSGFTSQFAMMLTQIALNKSLSVYGALSPYGSTICLAAAGITAKIAQLFFAVVAGISQGSQPIVSFNYGAKKYDRVKKTFITALAAVFAVSVVNFLLIQIFPAPLLSLFGTPSPAYLEFGTKFLRRYYFFCWAYCLHPVSAQFFAGIGKPLTSTFVALARQIILLLPLLLVLSHFFGLTGIYFAGPVADGISVLLAAVMIYREFKSFRT